MNYVAPFLLTLKLLPLMGQGTRIVNMVSCTYSIGKITPCLLYTSPYDERMKVYLEATGRKEVAAMADAVSADLQADRCV